MRIAIAYLALAVGTIGLAADKNDGALASVDLIEVHDGRSSKVLMTPAKISDPKAVAVIVDLVRKSPGKWKRGWGTSPAGNLRVSFMQGTRLVETIGVSGRFLVRGGSRDWRTKDIAVDFEAELLRLIRKEEPNHPPEPMPLTRHGSP